MKCSSFIFRPRSNVALLMRRRHNLKTIANKLKCLIIYCFKCIRRMRGATFDLGLSYNNKQTFALSICSVAVSKSPDNFNSFKAVSTSSKACIEEDNMPYRPSISCEYNLKRNRNIVIEIITQHQHQYEMIINWPLERTIQN